MAEIASGTAKLDDLSKVFSVRFEDLAREFLLLKRPFEFETLGRWWFRGDEIDLVALGKDTASLIEVKWKDLSERDARRVLKELEGKAELVHFEGKFRFGIIARGVEKKEELRKKGYLVWDLEDFY
jgi:AAA+ ATPase superfamily predicted ATPase